jgi:hypothetical protein
MQDIATYHRKEDPENGATYGELVACVDYFLTPEKFVAGSDKQLFAEDIYGPPGHPLPNNFRQLNLRVKEQCEDSLTNLAYQQASHSNHTHFQAELITSFSLYRSLAISKALAGNYFGAFLLRAVSDHYLEDFFSPGHITTYRNHLSDVGANSQHDHANQNSRLFVNVTSIRMHQLFSAVNFSCEPGAKLSPELLKLAPDMMRKPKSSWFAKYVAVGGCRGNCVKDEDSTAEGIKESQDNFVKKLGEFCTNLPKYGTTSVSVKGDGHLWREEQFDQRFLMLMVEVEGIREIVKASDAIHPDEADAAKKRIRLSEDDLKREIFSLLADRGTWQVTCDKSDRCEKYLIQTSIDGLNTNDPNRISYSPQNDTNDRYKGFASAVDSDAGGNRNSPSSLNQNSNSPEHQAAPALATERGDLVIGLSGSHEVFSFGDHFGRTSVGFDILPTGRVVTTQHWNWGLVVGAEGLYEAERYSYGFNVRPVFGFPTSETFVSMPIRELRHVREDGAGAWRTTVGLRLDQGFSSFFTLYLIASRDYAMQKGTSEVRRGFSYGAGIELAAPYCRVPIFGLLCNND